MKPDSSLSERILAHLSGKGTEGAALAHDLTFYATFAHKTFQLMQREGPRAEGYDRLQQSFREAVERVRATLGRAEEMGFPEAKVLLQLSPEGMAEMMDTMRELARIKHNER